MGNGVHLGWPRRFHWGFAVSAHDTDEVLCECDDCVAEDLALLARFDDPLAVVLGSLLEPQVSVPGPVVAA